MYSEFTAFELLHIYPRNGETYLASNISSKTKQMIDEQKYITFEPYHIIGCTFRDNWIAKWHNIITGFYFDENKMLRKFKIDFTECDSIFAHKWTWKEDFIETTMKSRTITCDSKYITPKTKDETPVKLICDELSLAHTYAFSLANYISQKKRDFNTYEKFTELYNDSDALLTYQNAVTEYSSNIILSIKTPKFERNPENKNTKTFDRVRCEISLRSYDNDTKIEFHQLANKVETDIDNIFNDIINTIENNKGWQKYDVPINILTCTHARICRDYTLETIFEIKEIKS